MKKLSCSVLLLLMCIAAGVYAQDTSETDNPKNVFPEAARFEPVKSGTDILYYKGYNRDGVFIGVVFKTAQQGYGGMIETMAGMKKDGTITAIKVLIQDETSGIGAKVAEESFAGQFKGRNIRELNNVVAVTGATISSKAVVDSVKKKAQEIMGLLSKQG